MRNPNNRTCVLEGVGKGCGCSWTAGAAILNALGSLTLIELNFRNTWAGLSADPTSSVFPKKILPSLVEVLGRLEYLFTSRPL